MIEKKIDSIRQEENVFQNNRRSQENIQLNSINSQEEVFNRNDPNPFVSIGSFESNLKINFQLNSLIRSYFQ